jgi:magnesium transporter
VVNGLLRGDQSLITPGTRIYFRDCYDHTIQVLDLIETYREMTASLLEMYIAGVSNRLNDIMRVLTVISTLFIPLTFITGIYGMNFDNPQSPWSMPELRWYYGYPFVWLVIIATVIGLLIFFKRRKWW